MWGVSVAAHEAIRRSSAVRIRVTAYTAVQGVLEVPVTGGSCTFDSGSNVRRQATVNFPNDPALWPDDPYSILSPWGTELGVEYGIVLPGGLVEWVPLIRGPITETPWEIGGTGDISCPVSDRCAFLSDDRFDVTTTTGGTLTVVDQIKAYIWETLPDVLIVDLTGSTKTVPKIDVQQDRLDAVVKLAEAISAEVYCDRLGNFVIAPQATVDDPWTFELEGAGLIVGAKKTATRDSIYNRVRVSGQTNTTSTDGTTNQVPPVYSVAVDDDPQSPTRYGGPFGRKTRFYVSSLITTQAQADSAAASLLQKVLGKGMKVSLTAITDPTLDAGDVGTVTVRGQLEVHVLDSVTIPFDVSSTQAVETRVPVLPEEQDQQQAETPVTPPASPPPATPAVDQTVVQVVDGSVTDAEFDRLLALGYTGRAGDNVEALYVPRNVLEQVKAEY